FRAPFSIRANGPHAALHSFPTRRSSDLNNHVVEGATQLQVILRDQSRPYDARIVGTSPQDDIAVIKIDARDLPALSFGDSHNLRDRKSTRLNSSHVAISYAVFCLKKKKN